MAQESLSSCDGDGGWQGHPVTEARSLAAVVELPCKPGEIKQESKLLWSPANESGRLHDWRAAVAFRPCLAATWGRCHRQQLRRSIDRKSGAETAWGFIGISKRLAEGHNSCTESQKFVGLMFRVYLFWLKFWADRGEKKKKWSSQGFTASKQLAMRWNGLLFRKKSDSLGYRSHEEFSVIFLLFCVFVVKETENRTSRSFQTLRLPHKLTLGKIQTDR